MHRRAARVIPALCVVLLGAAACTAASDNPTVGPTPGAALPSSSTALPTFTAAQFRRLMGQLSGTPVAVNVWASWCGPCVAEAPDLARTAREYEGRVQFIGVDIQDHLSPARAFVRRFGWPYPSVFDPTGEIRDSLGVLGQPNTVLFDRTGKQAFVISGPATLTVLRAQLDKLVGAG